MRAADTNVLVRLITRDDEKQVRTAEAFIAPGVWVSHVVLAEVCWVLRTAYGRSHTEIADIVEMLFRQQQVAMQDRDVVESALRRYRSRPALGFTDCLVLEIAKKAGHVPFGTFDRAFARLDGAQHLE